MLSRLAVARERTHDGIKNMSVLVLPVDWLYELTYLILPMTELSLKRAMISLHALNYNTDTEHYT